MAWTPSIPYFPEAFDSLPDPLLRRRVEDARVAGHTLVSAIDAWDEWLNLAKVSFVHKGSYDVETGDAISRAGATAIRALCGLALRNVAFSGDGGHLLQHWPKAPSDCIDRYIGVIRRIQDMLHIAVGDYRRQAASPPVKATNRLA